MSDGSVGAVRDNASRARKAASTGPTKRSDASPGPTRKRERKSTGSVRIKTLIGGVLQRYPPLFRLASNFYHTLLGSFRPLSPGGPEAVRRAIGLALEARGDRGWDYYEFGLFRGFTFLCAFEAIRDHRLTDARLYGFDSFEGLPEIEGADSGEGQFFSGQFACGREKVEANLSERGIDWARATLIEGFYNESLTESLRSEYPFRSAGVVLLDCDLYSSTRDALSWLTPYLVDGSIVLFDDWMSYGGSNDSGQPKAWTEFLAANPGYSFETLFSFPHNGLAVRLRVDA